MPTPNMPQDGAGEALQVLRPGPAQTVTLAAAPVSATPFDSRTRTIRVIATANVNFVANGTATLTDTLLPAGAYEYFAVDEGDVPSFLDPAGGPSTVYVTEMQ